MYMVDRDPCNAILASFIIKSETQGKYRYTRGCHIDMKDLKLEKYGLKYIEQHCAHQLP